MFIYFALTLLVLLGFVGLAVDVGRMELNTIQLQAVADDAALTAAAEFENGNSNWQSLGKSEATAAATVAGLSNVTPAVQLHADTGPYNLDYSAVQVTVTQAMPIYFMSLVTGSKTRTLKATAVADAQPCSYFTNPNLYPSTSVHLASTSLPGFSGTCPLYAAGSITNDYFSRATTGQVKVAGPASASPDISGAFYSSSYPIFSAPVLPDPLAYVTAPVFSACTPGDSSLVINTVRTLSPGTYCGGLTIQNTTVTFLPGLYIITGGFSLTQGTIRGTGVTLYFTKGGGSSFGNVVCGNTPFTQSAFAYLSAPTDNSAGGIPAVVLYTDPAWTGSGGIQFQGCNWTGDGVFYSKVAGIGIQYSTVGGTNYFGMDTYSFYDYQASVFIVPNYATLPGGNPFHIAATLVQ